MRNATKGKPNTFAKLVLCIFAMIVSMIACHPTILFANGRKLMLKGIIGVLRRRILPPLVEQFCGKCGCVSESGNPCFSCQWKNNQLKRQERREREMQEQAKVTTEMLKELMEGSWGNRYRQLANEHTEALAEAVGLPIRFDPASLATLHKGQEPPPAEMTWTQCHVCGLTYIGRGDCKVCELQRKCTCGMISTQW